MKKVFLFLLSAMLITFFAGCGTEDSAAEIKQKIALLQLKQKQLKTMKQPRKARMYMNMNTVRLNRMQIQFATLAI